MVKHLLVVPVPVAAVVPDIRCGRTCSGNTEETPIWTQAETKAHTAFSYSILPCGLVATKTRRRSTVAQLCKTPVECGLAAECRINDWVAAAPHWKGGGGSTGEKIMVILGHGRESELEKGFEKN